MGDLNSIGNSNSCGRSSGELTERVHSEIINTIDGLISAPERYPLDKYKLENKGDYRAFELHSLRVAYFVGNDVIRILRVRHTSREAKEY
jgi:plasmid stabilization system protein ParE